MTQSPHARKGSMSLTASRPAGVRDSRRPPWASDRGRSAAPARCIDANEAAKLLGVPPTWLLAQARDAQGAPPAPRPLRPLRPRRAHPLGRDRIASTPPTDPDEPTDRRPERDHGHAGGAGRGRIQRPRHRALRRCAPASAPARRSSIEPIIRDLLLQEGIVTSRPPQWARSRNAAPCYLQIGEWMLFILRPDERRPGRYLAVTALNGPEANDLGARPAPRLRRDPAAAATAPPA